MQLTERTWLRAWADRRPPWSGQAGWHLADWGPWGWAESVVKLVAVAIGVASAAEAGGARLPRDHRISYFVITIIAIGYIGTLAERAKDRELFSMAFAGAMLVGHWSMVWSMGQNAWPADQVRAFAALMMIGEVIKIALFTVTGARVRTLPRTLPIALTTIVAFGYVIAFLAA